MCCSKKTSFIQENYRKLFVSLCFFVWLSSSKNLTDKSFHLVALLFTDNDFSCFLRFENIFVRNGMVDRLLSYFLFNFFVVESNSSYLHMLSVLFYFIFIYFYLVCSFLSFCLFVFLSFFTLFFMCVRNLIQFSFFFHFFVFIYSLFCAKYFYFFYVSFSFTYFVSFSVCLFVCLSVCLPFFFSWALN